MTTRAESAPDFAREPAADEPLMNRRDAFRIQPRKGASTAVSITGDFGDTPAEGFIRDISATGLALELPALVAVTLNVGDAVDLAFQLPKGIGVVGVQSTVRYVEPIVGRRWDRVGLAFCTECTDEIDALESRVMPYVMQVQRIDLRTRALQGTSPVVDSKNGPAT